MVIRIIDIEKIDHFAMEHAVDQIADGTAENKRQRCHEPGRVARANA